MRDNLSDVVYLSLPCSHSQTCFCPLLFPPLSPAEILSDLIFMYLCQAICECLSFPSFLSRFYSTSLAPFAPQIQRAGDMQPPRGWDGITLTHTHMDWKHRLFSGLDNDQWLSKCCEWTQKTQSVFAVWADMLTAAIFCPDSWLTVQLGSELPLRVCAFMWSHASLFFKENKVFKRKISSLVALLNSS